MRIWTGLILAGMTSLALAAGPTAPKKMQCWTDNTGKRACGDRVPPEYAKTERQQLDAQGRVVGTKAREKTAEELVAIEAEKKAISDEKERLAKQTGYDKYLLQTFGSVAEMQGVRESRIASIEGRIKLAEKGITENEASLKTLKERQETLVKAGKEADPKLAKQIKSFESALVDGLKVASQLKVEREQTQARFAADIVRFRGLRAGEIEIGSKPGPAAPAAPAETAASPSP